MKVTITGGTGFIGRPLVAALVKAGHTPQVLTRGGAAISPPLPSWAWDPLNGPPPEESLREADAVIHLAGEPVAQRWTEAAKRRIRDSRVIGTRHLVEGLAKLDRRPAVFISSSAVGYYGSRGDELLEETSAPGKGYLAEVCVEWEREARAAAALGMRVLTIRTGLVLGRNGGALEKMLTPFGLGLGGRLGSGEQWMPWIHLEDLTEMYIYGLMKPVSGAWNGVSPSPVRNRDFTQALARALHRPAILPVPEFALGLALGEMSSVLLASQRVVPRAPEQAGFSYRWPELQPALDALIPGNS
jgi:uncharacterized protein (TIGR01777 family)